MSYERDGYGNYVDQGHQGPGPRLMGADTLIGDHVHNMQDEHLGTVKEIMLDMQSGQVAYVVMASGGVLTIGEKLFAIPWEALALDTANTVVHRGDAARLQRQRTMERWRDAVPSDFRFAVAEFVQPVLVAVLSSPHPAFTSTPPVASVASDAPGTDAWRLKRSASCSSSRGQSVYCSR